MGAQGLQQQEPDNEKVINCRLGYEAEPTQTLSELLTFVVQIETPRENFEIGSRKWDVGSESS